jgi:hypothetical protein
MLDFPASSKEAVTSLPQEQLGRLGEILFGFQLEITCCLEEWIGLPGWVGVFMVKLYAQVHLVLTED